MTWLVCGLPVGSPRDSLDGGLETAAIVAFRWVKGSGPVPT